MTNTPVDIVTDIAQLDNFDADDNLVEFWTFADPSYLCCFENIFVWVLLGRQTIIFGLSFNNVISQPECQNDHCKLSCRKHDHSIYGYFYNSSIRANSADPD